MGAGRRDRRGIGEGRRVGGGGRSSKQNFCTTHTHIHTQVEVCRHSTSDHKGSIA